MRERFGNFFSEMFSELFYLKVVYKLKWLQLLCATGIQELIENLPNSAPGPVSISMKLFMLCKYEASSRLCLPFQQSLRTCEIPAK